MNIISLDGEPLASSFDLRIITDHLGNISVASPNLPDDDQTFVTLVKYLRLIADGLEHRFQK